MVRIFERRLVACFEGVDEVHPVARGSTGCEDEGGVEATGGEDRCYPGEWRGSSRSGHGAGGFIRGCNGSIRWPDGESSDIVRV